MTPLADPTLDWHNLHEVVPQGDGQDRHGGNIQHWVELADLADHGNILKVLVVEFVDLARESCFSSLWRA